MGKVNLPQLLGEQRTGKLHLWYQVVPRHLHEVSGDVPELLGRGDNMDPLVQEQARFFFEQSVRPHC